MTTTPTQQPEALLLSDALATGRHMIRKDKRAAAELERQHTEIARLTAENEALRAKAARMMKALEKFDK
jgi:hypothetical protein